MQENGVLYFIETQPKFQNKKTKGLLTYDLTYLSSKDSILMNFSFFDREIRTIDSIVFSQKQLKITGRTNKIFVETDKRAWKHRYSVLFSYEEFSSFFKNANESFTNVTVYTKESTSTLETKGKKWAKQAELTNKIIALINANKN